MRLVTTSRPPHVRPVRPAARARWREDHRPSIPRAALRALSWVGGLAAGVVLAYAWLAVLFAGAR